MKRICITGGPCSGKDTALTKEYLPKTLREVGLTAVVGQESATEIILTGLDPPMLLYDDTRERYLQFQELIIDKQFFLEDEILRRAGNILEADVALINRGLKDAASYMGADEFAACLQKKNIAEIEARDGRYDAVFHMRTIAAGKPDLYEELFRKNPARHEDTPEKARESDARTLREWLGHPHLRVIPNVRPNGELMDFEEKYALLVGHILRVLDRKPKEIERKFLIPFSVNPEFFPVPIVMISIEQTYLKHEWIKGSRVRKRTQNDASLYYVNKKTERASPATRTEYEAQISEKQYLHLLSMADPTRRTIEKERYYFVWNNQYFELDIFLSPEFIAGLTILEIELLHENDPISIPDWLTPSEEITGCSEYSNRNLAKRAF